MSQSLWAWLDIVLKSWAVWNQVTGSTQNSKSQHNAVYVKTENWVLEGKGIALKAELLPAESQILFDPPLTLKALVEMNATAILHWGQHNLTFVLLC